MDEVFVPCKKCMKYNEEFSEYSLAFYRRRNKSAYGRTQALVDTIIDDVKDDMGISQEESRTLLESYCSRCNNVIKIYDLEDMKVVKKELEISKGAAIGNTPAIQQDVQILFFDRYALSEYLKSVQEEEYSEFDPDECQDIEV